MKPGKFNEAFLAYQLHTKKQFLTIKDRYFKQNPVIPIL